MEFQGVLKKMKTEITDVVQYYLEMENHFLNMNQFLKHTLEFKFEGYKCLNCGEDKKIFRQGFCYECFYESPAVGDWIMKPELSEAHLDIEDRDLAFEKKVQLQPHVVYLALSSNVKVGVTRKSQVPTRFIDQGATQALQIVETPNRYLAGITEVALKEHVADKTSWQKMLKNDLADDDLLAVKEQLKTYIPEEVQPYFLQNHSKVITLNYPVEKYPTKVTSLNLDKKPTFTGKLYGIKGQYLIFEDNTVFNIRNNEGYRVTLSVN